MANPPKQAHLVAAGKFHDIDFARLELLKLLAEDPSIRTTVAMDYSNTERLAQCDLLITYTCDLAPDDKEIAALRSFVEGGGRWLALHGTNALLKFLDDGRIGVDNSRNEFMDILGTQFLAHPPIGPFQVEVSDPEHPLTRGIEPFQVVDELYLFEQRAPIKPLLHARFSGNCAPFAAADWPETDNPVLYLRELGQGAVLYNSLGHCRSHYDTSPAKPFVPHPERCAWNYPVYYQLLRRGIHWAAGRSL